MKRLLLIVLLVLPLGGCVVSSGCYGAGDKEICANVKSFMRPLQEVSYTRTDEGIGVRILYSKEQVTLQAATELAKAIKGG